MRLLFERDAEGRLYEVPMEARGNRRVTTMPITADILFTPDEEQARDIEERNSIEAREVERLEREERRALAMRKLTELGLSPEDIKHALS